MDTNVPSAVPGNQPETWYRHIFAAGRLTLHLHLRVGLAVAVHVGGVADVLS